MRIPDSLAHKMELFRTRAHVITYKDGLFLEPSWLAVYFGQRVMPRAYDPRVDSMDGGEIAAQLTRVRDNVQNALMCMPSHEHFLQQYCPADARPAASGSRA